MLCNLGIVKPAEQTEDGDPRKPDYTNYEAQNRAAGQFTQQHTQPVRNLYFLKRQRADDERAGLRTRVAAR